MLQYDRMGVLEGIDINKISESKESILCHYWYFKDVGYMIAYELKNIVILNAKGVDFRCILWGISKNDVVDRWNNSVLEVKGVL